MKKDTVAPKNVTGQVTKTMINSITVEANGQDDLSGLYGFGYKYKITTDRDYKTSAEAQKAETLPYTYKYKDLKGGQTYKLQIIAYDKAGNTAEVELEQRTRDLAIGEYADYTPDYGEYVVKGEYSGYQVDGVPTDQVFRTEELEWRIWDFDIEKDKLVLISATPTKTSGIAGDGKLNLRGIQGFNNGIKLLNDLCKECYSSYSLDATSETIGGKLYDTYGFWELKRNVNPNTIYPTGVREKEATIIPPQIPSICQLDGYNSLSVTDIGKFIQSYEQDTFFHSTCELKKGIHMKLEQWQFSDNLTPEDSDDKQDWNIRREMINEYRTSFSGFRLTGYYGSVYGGGDAGYARISFEMAGGVVEGASEPVMCLYTPDVGRLYRKYGFWNCTTNSKSKIK